jgi:ribonuclease P protein component
MSVTYLPADGGVRVAYAVGRRVGPAVVRNRVRRRLRAAVREIDRSGAGLADGAYLIAVRPAAADSTYRELRDDLARACAAASGRPG